MISSTEETLDIRPSSQCKSRGENRQGCSMAWSIKSDVGTVKLSTQCPGRASAENVTHTQKLS